MSLGLALSTRRDCIASALWFPEPLPWSLPTKADSVELSPSSVQCSSTSNRASKSTQPNSTYLQGSIYPKKQSQQFLSSIFGSGCNQLLLLTNRLIKHYDLASDSSVQVGTEASCYRDDMEIEQMPSKQQAGRVGKQSIAVK